jgi:putative redox protein
MKSGAHATLTSHSGYAQTVRIRQYQLAADEPVSGGGTDTGPAPDELVLAGLGACTAITLRMYADRKAWELGDPDPPRLKRKKRSQVRAPSARS